MIALLSLIWGSTYFVIRQGLTDLPPFTSAAVRFALAAPIMAVLAWRLAKREGGRAPGLLTTLIAGTLNFGLSYGVIYWAETRIPSGLVSVLWAVFPMLMALASTWTGIEERLRPRQWGGFVLGFAGVLLLFLADLRALGMGAIVAGAWVLLSPIVTTIGQIRIKRESAEVSSLLLNRNAMAVGALCLISAALVFERDASVEWTPRAVFSVAYLTVIGTVVTFGLYYWVLRSAPTWKLSVIAYLTPTLALALGALAGGEPVGVSTVGGMAAILLGVALVMDSRGRTRRR